MIWITNLAAPYRIPVWDRLAESVDLTVVTLAENEQNRSWSDTHASRHYIHMRREDVLKLLRLYWAKPSLLVSWAREFRSSAVLIGGWDHPAYWQARIIAALWRTPVVLFYESTAQTHQFTRGPIALARRVFFTAGQPIVLVPGAAAERAACLLGVRGDSIVRTFNCVDNDLVLHVAETSSRPSNGHIVICYVGQLIERKNLFVLVSAFFDAAPEVSELNIVGSGPLLGALEALVHHRSKAQPGKRVTFHGGMPSEEAIAVMVASDVLCLISTEEVWGLVVNEALVAGLQVIVADSLGVTPSISEMDGVHVVDGTAPAVVAVMNEIASIEKADRRIHSPALIEKSNPNLFAKDVLKAFRLG